MNTDGVIDEIRSRVDIVELISEYVSLKQAGRNHKGLCPFHSEKTPSFMVSQEKQIFHCFGCGAGGDIFGFLMKHENLEFRDALEVLARRAGVELKRQAPGERGMRAKLKEINGEALAFWVASLQKDRHAREYLNKRGISEESIKAFSLGYACPGWHTLLDRLKSKGYSEELIVKAGLAASGRKGPYDVFRARIIFPILDIHDEPVAFGGRVMDDSMPKYLNSPDTMLFKKGETLYGLGLAKEVIREKGYAMLVEGYLDAIMCHQNGMRHAVAPLGTALTSGQLRKLSSLTGKILLVFDGDLAGVAAAKRSLGLVLEQGLRGKVLLLPDGEDPDSILRAKGPEYFEKRIAGASSPVDFLLKTQENRTVMAKEAIAFIARINEPILRDEYILELSERTGIRELTVREELNRFKKTGSFSSAGTFKKGASTSHNEEVLLLSAVLSAPEKTTDIFRRIAIEDFRDTLVRGVFEKLLAEEPPVSRSAIDVAETSEEKALISRLSVNPGFDPSYIDRNIEDCIRKITTRQLDEKIQNARAAGDLRLLNRLYSERQKLMQGTG